MSNDLPVRPVSSRRTTSRSRQTIQAPEDLILPDGPVGEETAELLADLLQPHGSDVQVNPDDIPDDADPEEEEQRAQLQQLPWWKRPSPYWLLCAIPVTALASTSTTAPRVEIYRMLACSVLKPDIFREDYPEYAPLHHLAHTLLNAKMSSDSLPIDASDPGSSFDFFNKSQKCATDPLVTAEVATLIAAISVCTGILCVITTAWWGSYSDRHGRVKVMGISILGLLFTDVTFILVTHFYQHLPGGYWLLIVGPTVEGLLGGLTTGVAAIHAYIADTTTEHNRSRILSLQLGLLFSGMAFGPTLGSIVIRIFKHPIAVFYLATLSHLMYGGLVWYFLPESVTQTQMRKARAAYSADLQRSAPPYESNFGMRVLYKLRLLFSFLSPLSVFWPSNRARDRNPLKRLSKDWNLALLAAAYGSTISVMGSYQYKFQYAALQFGWTTEIIGYWLSLVAAVRAIFLTAILPLAISLFKPKPVILEIPATPQNSETTPLLAGSESRNPPTRVIKKEVHSPNFDLGLARVSLVVELVSYTFMAMARSSLPFTTFSLAGAMGTGFSPAVQSVTLALYTRQGGTEIGRLFGAMSVIQALCAQILAPALYGLVFVMTVTTFPSAIMFVTVFTIAIALVALLLVRLPKRPHPSLQDNEEQEPSSHTPSLDPR